LFLFDGFFSRNVLLFQDKVAGFLCNYLLGWNGHKLTCALFPLQGYPVEILPVTVAGIPSMHICLDFIPELVNQPHLEKQVWPLVRRTGVLSIKN